MEKEIVKIKKSVKDKRKKDKGFLKKLKSKIKKIREQDPNVYPMN